MRPYWSIWYSSAMSCSPGSLYSCLNCRKPAGHLEARVAIERIDAEIVAPRDVCVAMA